MKPNTLFILLISVLWPVSIAPQAVFGQDASGGSESKIELPDVGKPLGTEGGGTRKAGKGLARSGKAGAGRKAVSRAKPKTAPEKQKFPPRPKPKTGGGPQHDGTTGRDESTNAK